MVRADAAHVNMGEMPAHPLWAQAMQQGRAPARPEGVAPTSARNQGEAPQPSLQSSLAGIWRTAEAWHVLHNHGHSPRPESAVNASERY